MALLMELLGAIFASVIYVLVNPFRIFLILVVLSNSAFQPRLLLRCSHYGKENDVNSALLWGAIADPCQGAIADPLGHPHSPAMQKTTLETCVLLPSILSRL